jgi:nucleoside-diphosphate-sugar epimerase
MPALRWVGYLSTVGVYGNHDGAWVDEGSELRPKSSRATARVAAERGWLEAGEGANVPVAVFRLSGIYGPGRNALVNLANGTAKRTVKPGQVFNRIHVADIAGALAFLGGRELGGVFNVTDDEPGPPQDVVAFAASLMGVEPPPEVPYDRVEMTPMARSFWSDNKRVSNVKLKAAGYAFKFPDHRGALEAMWRDASWRGDRSGGAEE